MDPVNDLLGNHLMLWGGLAFFFGIGAGLFAEVDARGHHVSQRDAAIVSRLWETVAKAGAFVFVTGVLRANWVNWDYWASMLGHLWGR